MFPLVHGLIQAVPILPLLLDTFTDTDSTTFVQHVPDIDFIGGGWVLLAGGASISSNTGAVASGGAVKIDGGIADFTLTLTAVAVGASSIGTIMFRYQDESNYWWIRFNNNTNTFDLFQRSGGSNTQRATASVTITTGVTYTIVITCSGSDIAATLDGGNALSYSSATLADKTVFGLRATNGTVNYDNFTVTGDYPAVNISYPMPYATYQRNGSNQADIIVAGTYNGAATAIEYQLDGGAWSTLDATLAGSAFSGTIAAVGTGAHTIGVRWANDTSKTDSVANVRVGDVFGWIGQSNSCGRITNGQAYTGALPSSSFDERGIWRDLISSHRQTDEVDGIGFSVLPLLASIISDDQTVPVGFVEVGGRRDGAGR